MASTIKIKRSGLSTVPSQLKSGELAYSWVSKTLYIGSGYEDQTGYAQVVAIGGDTYTDLLSADAGVLTANKALIIGSDGKIDQLSVDNLKLDGNTLSSTNNNGDIILDPAGSGQVQLASNVEVTGNLTVLGTINATIEGNSDTATKWVVARDLTLSGDGSATFEDVDGSADVNATFTLATVNSNVGSFGSSSSIPVITVNAKGLVTGVTTASISTSLSISGATGTDTVELGSDTLNFAAGTGITTAVTNNTVTISGVDATTTTKGVASFNATDFSVSSGSVTLNASRIESIASNLITSGSQSGINVSYNATTDSIDFNVDDPTIYVDGDATGSGQMVDLSDVTVTLTLATVNEDTGSFGSASKIPTFTVNEKGLVTAASEVDVATSLSIVGDTGSDTISLLSDSLLVTGGTGVTVAITDNTVTISGDDATTTSKGIASFSSDSFDVTSGSVSIKSGGISNSQLANDSITIGSTEVTLGSSSDSLLGLTELSVDNLNINGNEIQSTNADGNIILNPNGTGQIDVSNARIIDLAEPINPTDAATKNYVDNAVTGLSWKNAVQLLADSNVDLTGNTNTLNIDNHATLTTVHVGYRILLIGQTTASENGIYVYNDNGTTYTLTRAADADTFEEISSASVWVLEGQQYGQTGWTQSNHYLSSFAGQEWVQFSGAGAYIAGPGLGQTGTEFFVNVATNGGIEIVDDFLQLKSTVAGNGLELTNGVLDVQTDGSTISITNDKLEIASTYSGQTSITTLGTITTGTWSATTIGTTKGGTGLTSYATGDLLYASAANTLAKLAAGDTGKILQVSASGVPVWADIDGGEY